MENYLYGSARVRVLENGLIGREKIERLLAAGDLGRCADLLAEFGVAVERDGNGKFLREETLLGMLRAAYREVEESTENAAFTRVFRRQYDCNNIKAAIKCAKRGVDPAGMLFDFGNFSAEIAVKCAEKNDFSALEEPFATAAREAVEAFAKTGNPQWVDLILDRACYAAMLRDASRNAFLLDLVRAKIDLTDILTCVRLLRMRCGEVGKMMLRDALIEGGTLGRAFFEEAYDRGEDALWTEIGRTALEAFARDAGGSAATLTAVERAADDYLMRKAKTAKMIPYGEEVLAAYLYAVEAEVRDLRVVLAGIAAGLPAKTVGERIRESYV